MNQSRAVLRPAVDRPHQDGGPGVVLRPGLAFGAHYDPERTSFGALVAHNVDELAAGAAYGPHSHRDTEILTWVLAGTLVHVGPDGAEDTVRPGELQYLATGTGWHHDERAGERAVRAVQMWLAPALEDPPAGAPERRVVRPGPGDAVLAGAGGLLALHRGGVEVALLRPGPRERHDLADGTARHVHVTAGSLALATRAAGPSSWAGPGDTLEITGPGARVLVAGAEGAEALVVTTR